MMKNKLYIFINILGMGIAIGCCITAYFNYEFNSSFDEYHNNAKEIYRVNMERNFQGKLTQFGIVPIPLGDLVRANVNEVEELTRYSTAYADLRVGDEIFDSNMSYVDPDFFKLFTFEFINGTPTSITNKGTVLISDELAMKLFNSTDVVGKGFTHIVREDLVHEYEIGGVFKMPPTNTSFNDEAFSLYENYWDVAPFDLQRGSNWIFRNTLFLRVKNPDRIPSIESQLKPYIENNNKVREDFILEGYRLDPLVGMAVRDRYMERSGTWTRDATPLAAVVGTGMMGILILLIACFNLTNTSIAISSRRLKEIGIRKVMGSMRGQLIAQFIGETTMICLISLLVGMMLAEFLFIPAFNALWPYMKLTANYLSNPDFMLMIAGVLVFTSLLAGAYPAFYISKFQPTSILKGTLKFGGTGFFTMFLLWLQFAISLTGIVCGFAFTENARYQREFDLGFDQKGVLFTWVNSESEFNALRDVMAQHPDVISIAGSEHHIFSSRYNDPIKHEGAEVEVDILHVGDQYLQTAGLTLLEGRDFQKDSETDRKESVIITEKLASKFGWAEPLGKEITWLDTVKLYVVGVVKDIYGNGLWRELEPTMLRYGSPEKYRHLIVNAPADKIMGVEDYMREKWSSVFPNRKYTSRLMDEQVVEASTVNNNIVKMFVFLAIVAVFLSITGLFTLVSLNIIKRMKEIGVRKVLGASIANITRIINTRFAIILFAACILGTLGGVFMSEMLMDSIWDYFQKVTPVTIGISCLILLGAAIVTVVIKTYNTAKTNPVNVLRDE